MVHQIVSHKYYVLLLSVLIAIPFLIRIPDLKTIDNVDYFANRNDRDVQFYEELKIIFGNDEFFIIAFKKETLFTARNLKLLKNLTDEIAGIDGVREAKSLANAEDTIGEKDFFIVRKFLETIPDDRQSLKKLETRALNTPLYVKNLISPDGNTPAIVVFVDKNPYRTGFRKKIITRTQAILDTYKGYTGKTHIAGWTLTNLVLTEYMKKDVAIFIPVTYGFIVLAILLFFQNGWLTMIAVVNTSLCMGCTMGLFPILDITLNNVTTIVPPVVMALALCDTVHIFSHLNRPLFEKYPDKTKAVAKLIRKLAGPCFLTTLTTFIGFLSLYLSDIPPIKEFSLIASMGILFEFIFAFTFLPAFMLLFNTEKLVKKFNCPGLKTVKMDVFLTRLSHYILKYFRLIFLIGVITILVSAGLSSKISVETDLLGYFKQKSPIRTSAKFVEQELAGIATLDISFKSPDENAFKKPDNLRVIQTLQNHINRLDGVDKTISFVDFIKKMNESLHNETPEFYRIPDSADMVSQFLLIYDSDDIRNFIDDSFNHARMSIRISKHSTRDQANIIKQIQALINRMDTRGITIRISGQVLQEVNTIDALVSGQIYSLVVTVIIILLIMFFVLRSFPLWVLSILPNLFPIILNFGIMGLFGIPLNTATALISTVAICIAVDDTIHFLIEFKQNMFPGADTRQAIKRTLQNKGRPLILSSMILTTGFGVMVFSRFVPTMNFGVLSAVIMITALIGDILILPSSALLFSSFIKGKPTHKI